MVDWRRSSLTGRARAMRQVGLTEAEAIAALAGSLHELRERIRAVLLEEGIGDGNFGETLAGTASGENRIVVCL